MIPADLFFGEPFGALLLDPPWTFKVRSDEGKGRSAEAHYDCMTLEDIKALPIGDLAAKDAALFLWVTDPLLPQCIDVMRGWGFAYKTIAFHWVKTKDGAIWLDSSSFHVGMGYWTRANPELCLIGTKGSPKRKSKAVRRLLLSERREHSRKPEEIHGLIEELVPGPYIELFARATRPGWTTVGNQVGLFDEGHVETRRIPSGPERKWT